MQHLSNEQSSRSSQAENIRQNKCVRNLSLKHTYEKQCKLGSVVKILMLNTYLISKYTEHFGFYQSHITEDCNCWIFGMEILFPNLLLRFRFFCCVLQFAVMFLVLLSSLQTFCWAFMFSVVLLVLLLCFWFCCHVSEFTVMFFSL